MARRYVMAYVSIASDMPMRNSDIVISSAWIVRWPLALTMAGHITPGCQSSWAFHWMRRKSSMTLRGIRLPWNWVTIGAR